jgi:ferredoxin
MTARLHVDWTACRGRGVCVELLPEVLDRDPWGYPLTRDGSREPVVAPVLTEHAERAVDLRHVNRSARPAGMASRRAGRAQNRPANRSLATSESVSRPSW